MQQLPSEPEAPHRTAITTFTDALQDLLQARAQSIGAIDVGVEENGWHVDGEVLFATGPDMGLSVDTRIGECRYCELVGDKDERWLEEVRGDVLVLDGGSDELMQALALEVLNGLLAARRPLLR